MRTLLKSITPKPIKTLYWRIKAPPAAPHVPSLIEDKKRIIDYAAERLGMRSFADLGGVWGVHGGYTFFAMEKYGITDAYLVDLGSSPELIARQETHPSLQLIKGHFGSPETAAQIEHVDAIFLFDVLLHQIAPNWDDILKLYAERTDSFLIYNQQYVGADHTVRLLDLGEKEYFENVPHTKESDPEYKDLFEKMYEVHPRHQDRIYRDMPDVWQWGIVDQDLIDVMDSLGFRMKYYKNCGRFGNLKHIENHSFAFSRAGKA